MKSKNLSFTTFDIQENTTSAKNTGCNQRSSYLDCVVETARYKQFPKTGKGIAIKPTLPKIYGHNHCKQCHKRGIFPPQQ